MRKLSLIKRKTIFENKKISMGKIKFIILFLIIFSCNHTKEVSLEVIKYKNNRLYYQIKNNTSKKIKFPTNEIPSIFINNEYFYRDENKKRVIAPFTINLLTNDTLLTNVRIDFHNSKQTSPFNQYQTSVQTLEPGEVFQGYLYLESSDRNYQYSPILENIDIEAEIIYNGTETLNNTNSDYYNKKIISNNRMNITIDKDD